MSKTAKKGQKIEKKKNKKNKSDTYIHSKIIIITYFLGKENYFQKGPFLKIWQKKIYNYYFTTLV